MATSLLKDIGVHYVGSIPFNTHTTFREIIENIDAHALSLGEIWGIGIMSSSEFPDYIGNQKTVLFLRVSSSMVYNKVLLFSEDKMWYGYFQYNDSLSLKWKQVTFT